MRYLVTHYLWNAFLKYLFVPVTRYDNLIRFVVFVVAPPFNWNSGGLLTAGVASNTILMGGQTSPRFSFAIEDVIQSSLNNITNDGLEFILLNSVM